MQPLGCDADIIGASSTDQDLRLITGEYPAVCNAIPRQVLTKYTSFNQYLYGYNKAPEQHNLWLSLEKL